MVAGLRIVDRTLRLNLAVLRPPIEAEAAVHRVMVKLLAPALHRPTGTLGRLRAGQVLSIAAVRHTAAVVRHLIDLGHRTVAVRRRIDRRLHRMEAVLRPIGPRRPTAGDLIAAAECRHTTAVEAALPLRTLEAVGVVGIALAVAAGVGAEDALPLAAGTGPIANQVFEKA
jgi:hypothetical protein